MPRSLYITCRATGVRACLTPSVLLRGFGEPARCSGWKGQGGGLAMELGGPSSSPIPPASAPFPGARMSQAPAQLPSLSRAPGRKRVLLNNSSLRAHQ